LVEETGVPGENHRPAARSLTNFLSHNVVSPERGSNLGGVMAAIVWYLDLQLPMQSVPITTDVVSSNLDQGEVYNIM
jgi:hypothetical protein